jgi:hypothetical protein
MGEYNDGAAVGTASGVPILYKDTGGVQREVSSTYPLPTAGGGGMNGQTAANTSSSTGYTNGSNNQTAVSPSTPLPVSIYPVIGTSLSLLPFAVSATASTIVKASAGQLVSAYADNLAGTTVYFQVYNQASGTATGTPIFFKSVPANGTIILDDTFFGQNGIYLSTGIVLALSTTATTYTAATAGNIGGTYV